MTAHRDTIAALKETLARIERGFTSTLVNGDDLYFVLAAAHDLFGNVVAGDDVGRRAIRTLPPRRLERYLTKGAFSLAALATRPISKAGTTEACRFRR